MRLELKDDLPFVTVQIVYLGKSLTIPGVLVDTGSATSIFSADQVVAIDLQPAPNDALYAIRGVGGNEVVFARVVDFIRVGEWQLADFEIEVGGMDYGFEINGILGMNFLTAAEAVIDLAKLELRFSV
jgi:hypothetical protein